MSKKGNYIEYNMTKHLLTTTGNLCTLLKTENLLILSQCPQNWIRFNTREFSCCISWPVPAGCAVSFFLVPFFLLGGTRDEWPTNSGKQKTLTDR